MDELNNPHFDKRKRIKCKDCGRLQFYVDEADKNIIYIKRDHVQETTVNLKTEEVKLMSLPVGTIRPIKHQQVFLLDHLSDYIDLTDSNRSKFHIIIKCPKCKRSYNYHYYRERLSYLKIQIKATS